MTPEEVKKLLTLVGVLPVLADFMQDMNSSVFDKVLKQKTNHLIDEIRKRDEMILLGSSIETVEQQHNIGLAFRKWVNNVFAESNPQVEIEDIIDIVNKHIKDNGITLHKFAKLSGVKYVNIFRFMQGYGLNSAELLKIMSYLGMF